MSRPTAGGRGRLGASYIHDANGSDTYNTHQSFAYNSARQATSTALGTFAFPSRQLAYRGPGQTKLIRDGSYTLHRSLLGIGARGGTYYARAVDGTLLSQRTTASRHNYLYDGEGSVVGLVNGNGQLTTSYRYDPYGHPPNQTPLGNENPFGWHGAYTAGVENAGVICGGPNATGGGYYDAEDGRYTAIAYWDVQGLGNAQAEGSAHAGASVDPVNSAKIEGGFGFFNFGYGENDDGGSFREGGFQIPFLDGAPEKLKLGFGFSGSASTGEHDGGGVGGKACFALCVGLNSDEGLSFGGGLDFGVTAEF